MGRTFDIQDGIQQKTKFRAVTSIGAGHPRGKKAWLKLTKLFSRGSETDKC